MKPFRRHAVVLVMPLVGDTERHEWAQMAVEPCGALLVWNSLSETYYAPGQWLRASSIGGMVESEI